jgi:hypothetical protein
MKPWDFSKTDSYSKIVKLFCCIIVLILTSSEEVGAQNDSSTRFKDRISTSLRFSHRLKSSSAISESSLGIEYSSFDYSTRSSFEFGVDFEYQISNSLSLYLTSFYSKQQNQLSIQTPLFTRDDTFPPFQYEVNRDFINFSTGIDFSHLKHSVRLGYSRFYTLQDYFDVVPGRVNLLADLFFDPNTNMIEGVALATQWTVQYSNGGGQHSGINLSYGYRIAKNLELFTDNQINFWGSDLLLFWISEGNVPNQPNDILVDQFEISNRFLFHSLGLKFTL